jgi:hypothetical protein
LRGSYTAQDDGGPTVQLTSGELTVDGRHIADPIFSKSGVSWRENTNTGYSTGSLQVMAHGAMLAGYVASGNNASSAAGQHVTLCPDETVFQTEVCRNPKASPQVWEAGPPLVVGVDFSGGVITSTVIIRDPNLRDIEIDGEPLPPPKDDNSNVVTLAISVSETAVGGFDPKPSYLLPGSGSLIEIGFDGTSFSGTIKPYDVGGAQFSWRGQSLTTAMAMAMAMASGPVVTFEEVPPSLMDLLSLDTANAAEYCQSKFQRFILYATDDDWRDKLLGVTKPVLDSGEASAYRDNAALFTSTVLCDAFLLKQITPLSKDAGGPSNKISDDDEANLEAFWKGDAGLALLDGYNDVSSRVTQLGYIEAQGRIKLYAEDTAGQWAHKLFDALTSEKALRQAVLAYIASSGNPEQIYRHTELFDALLPQRTETVGTTKCTLATKYHAVVMQRFSQQAGCDVTLDDPKTVAALRDWLPRWIEHYRDTLATQLRDPTLNASEKLRYQDALNEIELAERQFGNIANLTNEIVSDVSAASGKTLYAKLQSYFKSPNAQKYAANIGKAMAVGGTIFGLQQVVQLFRNWDNLSDAEKAKTVINTFTLGVQVMGLVADFKAWEIVTKLASPRDAFYEYVGKNLVESLSDEGNEFGFFSSGLRAVSEEKAVTKFEKIFGAESKYMKAFGVLVALAAIGFSAYQIYEDKDNETQTIMNSFALAADVLVLVGAIGAVAECAIAVLGPFGAVAGIVLAFVSMFMPPPDPVRPADDYMDKRGNKALADIKALLARNTSAAAAA